MDNGGQRDLHIYMIKMLEEDMIILGYEGKEHSNRYESFKGVRGRRGSQGEGE